MQYELKDDIIKSSNIIRFWFFINLAGHEQLIFTVVYKEMEMVKKLSLSIVQKWLFNNSLIHKFKQTSSLSIPLKPQRFY